MLCLHGKPCVTAEVTVGKLVGSTSDSNMLSSHEHVGQDNTIGIS